MMRRFLANPWDAAPRAFWLSEAGSGLFGSFVVTVVVVVPAVLVTTVLVETGALTDFTGLPDLSTSTTDLQFDRSENRYTVTTANIRMRLRAITARTDPAGRPSACV